jgi:hypothetical protein
LAADLRLPARLLRGLAAYPRRSPLTAAYLAVLGAVYLLVDRVLAPATATRLLRYVSTNPENLRHHPVPSLLASALFVAGPLLDPDTLVIVGVGLGVCMAWVERRQGSLRTAGIFLTGHVVTTLLTVPLIAYGIATARYDPALRGGLDFGVSYGAATMAGAVTPLLPGWARPLWVLALLGYPLHAAVWSGGLPDFTTAGHVIAGLVGLALGFAAARGRPPAQAPPATCGED